MFQICAGNDGGGDDSCEGDSGGPLVLFNTRAFQYTMVGMAAGGVMSNCVNRDFPEVFIRIDHPQVLDFINSKKDQVLDPSESLDGQQDRYRPVSRLL